MNYGIAILSYNHPDLTAKCVKSVLSKIKGNHVFLTHNGSLQKHVEQLKNQFPDIHHIVVEKNSGFSGGANRALKASLDKFKQVLFLTNDTEVIHLPESAPTGFNSVKLMRRNSDEIDSVMGALNPKNGRLKHLKNISDQKPRDITYIPGTAFWIDQDVFQTLEGFDERFHTYWEDVDFSLRAHKKNILLKYDDKTVCRHKIGKTCHKDRFYTYELYQRNLGRCLSKNNLLSVRFYFHYLPDILKYSRSDYRKAYSIFRNHRLKEI
jgi:GT2 family glycosyltransferase